MRGRGEASEVKRRKGRSVFSPYSSIPTIFYTGKS